MYDICLCRTTDDSLAQLRSNQMIVKINFKTYQRRMPPVRFELTTPGLQDQCSATEL